MQKKFWPLTLEAPKIFLLARTRPKMVHFQASSKAANQSLGVRSKKRGKWRTFIGGYGSCLSSSRPEVAAYKYHNERPYQRSTTSKAHSLCNFIYISFTFKRRLYSLQICLSFIVFSCTQLRKTVNGDYLIQVPLCSIFLSIF